MFLFYISQITHTQCDIFVNIQLHKVKRARKQKMWHFFAKSIKLLPALKLKLMVDCDITKGFCPF